MREKAESSALQLATIVPATPGACVLYGDRLEAGPEAVVTIETTSGVRHVGGQYDPVFEAPEAVEAVSPGVASYVGALYRSLFAKSVMTAAATGRASLLEATGEAPDTMRPCPGSGVASRPARSARRDPSADRRRSRRDRCSMETVRAAAFGAGDPARERGPRDQLRLKPAAARHVALPLRPGDIHPNETLTLEIVDGRGGKLTYELIVVEPKDLPLPPAAMPSQWLVAAWRLAAGPPDTRLDSIARLQTAPPQHSGGSSHFRGGLERPEAVTFPQARGRETRRGDWRFDDTPEPAPTADPSRGRTSRGRPSGPRRSR